MDTPPQPPRRLGYSAAVASPSNLTPGPVHQFSTPPGPPVFSSPLRPAAVPFRTSPATPQPVSFSMGSSLPTSSSSHCSNGSHELPLHHSADEFTFECPYVFFSAHKVLFVILLNNSSFAWQIDFSCLLILCLLSPL